MSRTPLFPTRRMEAFSRLAAAEAALLVLAAVPGCGGQGVAVDEVSDDGRMGGGGDGGLGAFIGRGENWTFRVNSRHQRILFE